MGSGIIQLALLETDELFISSPLVVAKVVVTAILGETARLIMDYSRDMLCQAKSAYDEGGIEALKEMSRRRPTTKN